MFHNSRTRGTDLNQLERLLSLSFESAPKTTTLPSLCMTPTSSVTLVFKSIPWVRKNPSAVHLQARPFYFAPMAMETKHCPCDCPHESPSSRRPPSCCHLSSLSRLTSNDLRPCSPSRWLQGNDDLICPHAWSRLCHYYLCHPRAAWLWGPVQTRPFILHSHVRAFSHPHAPSAACSSLSRR